MSAGCKHGILVVTLLMLSLMAGALALTGCAARIPGDGRLVLVDFGPGLYTRPVNTPELGPVTFGRAVDAGVTYWDAVGARIRTRADLSATERAMPVAATVTIRCATSTETRLEDTFYDIDAFAWYYEVDGNIRVDCTQPTVSVEWTWLTASFAHEIGHALGLEHVGGPAVMNAAGSDFSALQPADVAEFCRTAIYGPGICNARS